MAEVAKCNGQQEVRFGTFVRLDGSRRWHCTCPFGEMGGGLPVQLALQRIEKPAK